MAKRPLLEMDGFVLSSAKYKEDSAIVTFASRDGIVSLLASHIYKPKSLLKPLALTFNYVRVNYQDTSKILVATQAVTLVDISSCYLSYEKNIFLVFLEELSLLLYKEGNDYPIEEVLLILEALKNDSDILTLCLLLLGCFYKDLGLTQNISSCVLCHKSTSLTSFDLERGGFLCEDDRIKEGVPSRKNIELQIFKFAFLDVNETNVKRVVPKSEGKAIFIELLNYLLDYFDLKQIKSISLLLSMI